MKRISKVFVLLPAAALLLAVSCDSGVGLEPRMRRPDSLDLEEVTVHLPDAEGKALVERACVPCHSLRYIEMQPELSRTSWEKTVHKMVKSYGAPVRDSVEEKAIVDYLDAYKQASPANNEPHDYLY